MSRHGSDELEGSGYLLPEDSQLRLARLSEHIRFLVRLAQSNIRHASLEHAPEVSLGELTFCLEALADQLDLVLDDVSWPAQGKATVDAPERDITSTARPGAPDTNTGRFIFGVTLDQIDTLERLIQTISAHGDVVSSSDMADLAEHTLPMLGYAIFDGAVAVRDILAEVKEQRLRDAPHRRPGVGEERGVYAVGLVSSAAAGLDKPLGGAKPAVRVSRCGPGARTTGAGDPAHFAQRPRKKKSRACPALLALLFPLQRPGTRQQVAFTS